MNFVRWDPFQRFGRPYWTDLNDTYADCTWKPVVDIYAGEGEIVIVAEIPGVKREDMDIEVQQDRITLRGTRKMDAEGVLPRPFRRERCYGPFFRAFTLPIQVDPSGTSASLRDGILEIRLPVLDAHRIRQIPIDCLDE